MIRQKHEMWVHQQKIQQQKIEEYVMGFFINQTNLLIKNDH